MDGESVSTLRRAEILHEPVILPVSDTVLLRQLSQNDTENVFNIIDENRDFLNSNGNAIGRSFPTLEVTQAWMAEEGSARSSFGIWDKDKLIGCVNYRPKDESAEIGIFLAQEYTGQGYATMAMSRLVDHCVDDMGFRQITALVNVVNEDSLRLAEKLGFTYQGLDPDHPDFYVLEYQPQI